MSTIATTTKSRRVVHLLYSGLGGHGSVFFSLVKGDVKKQFQTCAIFCGIEEMRSDYVRQCEAFGVPYIAIKKSPGLDLKTIKKIVGAFSKYKPDTIFLHGASFILPALWYKLLHPKTRIVLRDTQAHHLKSKRDWIFLKLAIRYADHLVLLTKESFEGLAKRLVGNPFKQKATIISNGLDTVLYSSVPVKDISNTVVIGMQSRLQKIKDHPALFRSFALLKKRFPDKRLSLKIAGDGETMTDLRRLATELEIDQEVDFAGMLNENELLSFMHSLDIYVHATFGETMSNSIMQGMSCGLPIVASDVWGVNNMVKDGVNGSLYISEDENSLSAKVAEIIENQELRIRLGRTARIYAEQEYSLETLFKKYAILF